MKNKIKTLKNKLKNKKGMNSIETTIIVLILCFCILTMLDLMEITQKMSATTSAINYVTRLVGRQGGISNGTPENFSAYGHGSYITSDSAVDIINVSLRKAFSVTDDSSVLGNQVKIYIQPYYLDRNSGKYLPDGTIVELNKNAEIGVYIKGSHIQDNLLIHQDDVLYHQVYYLVTADMYYPAFTIERLITFSDSYFNEREGYVMHKKRFTRFIMPTYYNRDYLSNSDYVNSPAEWYVK